MVRRSRVIENGMPAGDLTGARWRKSLRSNSSGNCVEFADLDGAGVAVRDSKNPHGPALVFSRAEAAGFVRALKAGAHDHLLEASH